MHMYAYMEGDMERERRRTGSTYAPPTTRTRASLSRRGRCDTYIYIHTSIYIYAHVCMYRGR